MTDSTQLFFGRTLKEKKSRSELLIIESKIVDLNNNKEQIINKLSEQTILKKLLFEKGKMLETATIEALRILGFEAHPYKESDSEFDVVFTSREGRLIGEVEGKDDKSVNINKLRQLEMNLHEDFSRDEINEPAKGALIGNAYRLSDLPDRKEFFTTKCITAAHRSQTALIRSVDLFKAAQYLDGNKNARFALKCRKAILNATGIVKFPTVSRLEAKNDEDVSVERKS